MRIRVLVAALLTLACEAAAQEVATPVVRAREIWIDTDELVDDARSEAVQSTCTTHFFGRSTGLGLGGDGTVFVGSIVPLGSNAGTAYPVLGPGFSLSGAYSVRVLRPRCEDPGAKQAHPATKIKAIVPQTGNHLLYVNFGLGGSVLSLLDLTRGESVSLSLAVTVPIGVRYEYVWWDKPNDIGSRQTLSLGLGGIAGYGSLSVKGSSSGSTAGGALLFGGYVSARLLF